MKFEESKYFNTLKTHKLTMSFGEFYFCEKFFVAEVHEGIHFDWDMIKKVMDKLVEFHGQGIKLGYISNRINPYSVDPQSWIKVDAEYNIIIASAIVYYNNIAFMNATLEKKFYKKSIKRCLSLDEAVDWILNIKELN
ncbi:hypothetical protein [Confluentibacter flavum]|uniref:STAS/SEC14 domain-containing protein n=1 Tax=Confluentibacter flavum TaxID=1909700 RepID=A0A2N3HKQ9_9FLAO|nr:hypothetical protein [Confluentibacter flavum]PKQ45503.1 hypothetical protein CSW08_07715 [Confluentibacter flavum]